MTVQGIIALVIIILVLVAMITLLRVAQKDHKKKVDEIIKNIKERKITYVRKDDNTFVRKK